MTKPSLSFYVWLRRQLGPVTTGLIAVAIFLSGVSTVFGSAPPASGSAVADSLTQPAIPPLNNFIFLPLLAGAPAAASAPRIYWGALANGQPPTNAALQPGGVFHAVEAEAHKGMSILHWGEPWVMDGSFQPFQTDYFNNTRQHGSIPLLDWGSWTVGGPDQPAFRLSAISSGQYDSFIGDWATGAKAWGHPFFLRFDWEMNGNWQFPWSAQLNGNTAGEYIQAWRHVHDIFTQTGAKNATWVWCPNISGSTTLAYSSLYPGDNYVDWTCLDGYNKYVDWLGFNTIFTGNGINWLYSSYSDILAVAPTKPIMIGETASLEAGDGGAKKAAWITDALGAQLQKNLPGIKAIVWFNWDDNSSDYATLPIESSPASLAAFASAIGSSYYAANEFASIGTSPIPPP